MIIKQSTYLRHSAENIAVFRCLLNVSFSSTVLMLPGTLFQLMGPWQANARCPHDFVLAAAMVRIFGSNDERSGLAGVYTFNNSDRYFGYAVINAVWHSQSCKQFYWVLVANVTFSEEVQYVQFLAYIYMDVITKGISLCVACWPNHKPY